MTIDTAVASARSAADAYADAIAAERHLFDILPAPDHPDRPTVEGSLAAVGRAARRAYDRYHSQVLGLIEAGFELQASKIVNDVQDRIAAARTPVAIPITEGN
jgi:hypothetical protein